MTRAARPGLLLLLAVASCSKTMTADDCQKAEAHMREVWLAEAKKAAPADGVPADKAQAVIKSETEKLASDWAATCKKELEGRRIDPKEMSCVLKAGSIEDIHRCAEL